MKARAASFTADGRWQHDLVAHSEPINAPAGFHDFADGLVADAEADIPGKALAVIDVQVAATDRASVDADDRIAIGLQLWIVHLFKANVARAVVA